MTTFEQKRGIANLTQLLNFLKANDVPRESAQAVLDAVYEGGCEDG